MWHRLNWVFLNLGITFGVVNEHELVVNCAEIIVRLEALVVEIAIKFGLFASNFPSFALDCAFQALIRPL